MSGVSYDPAAAVYDATRGYLPGVAEKIRDFIIHATGTTARTRYLELGVGTGRIALPFILAGDTYTGTDLSQAMLRQLMRKISPKAEPPHVRCHAVRGDVCQLPFAADTFDVVLAVNVLHLVDDAVSALQEARRVMSGSHGQFLIARDGRYELLGSSDVSPSRLVQQQWDVILASLGLQRQSRQASPWMRLGGEATRILDRSGALWKGLPPLEYEATGRSARDACEDLKVRAYTDEWSLTDDIHSEGIQRLTRWLNESCPNPDHVVPRVGRFEALVVSWPEGR